MASPITARPRPRRAARAWVLVALGVLAAGANMSSPLYPGYQQRFGFGDLTLTVVYATYALVSVPALLWLGPRGDRLPARALLRGGVVVAAAGTVCLAVAQNAVWLVAGRVAYGVALGAVTGVGMALVARGRGAGAAGAVAFLVGSAAGPGLAGLLAQYAPAPELLPYLVQLVCLVAVFLGLATVRGDAPSTADPTAAPTRTDPGRRALLTAAVNGFLGWTVAGLFLGLGPSVLGRGAGAGNLAVSGLAAGGVLACSALTPPLVPRLGARRAQHLGLVAAAAALGVLSVAGTTPSAILFCCVVGGAAHGLLYGGAAATADALAPAGRASATTATVYVAFYLGAGLPALVVGTLSLVVSLDQAVAGIAAVGLLLCLASVRPTRALPVELDESVDGARRVRVLRRRPGRVPRAARRRGRVLRLSVGAVRPRRIIRRSRLGHEAQRQTPVAGRTPGPHLRRAGRPERLDPARAGTPLRRAPHRRLSS